MQDRCLFSQTGTGSLEEKIEYSQQESNLWPSGYYSVVQGPVVRKVDNAIHWTNLYPVDNTTSR